MVFLGRLVVLPRDSPVCFPARPCLEFSPYEADVINLTSTLTPVSSAIAGACAAALGLALVLVAVGLVRVDGPWLRLVVLSTALAVLGAGIAIALEARSSAMVQIYGRDLPGGTALDGSWDLVSLIAQGMALAGLIGLIATASVAVVRLRRPADLTMTSDPTQAR